MATSTELVKTKPFEVTWLDRFLIGLAPKWGMRRVRARAAVTAFSRHFDAASTGRRTAGWYRASSDANSAIRAALSKLRELSRDLRRNNSWARRGIQAIANNVTGWGIRPKPVGVDPDFAKKAITLWNLWADSARCDFDGRMPFYGLQRLVMDAVVESGEVLVVKQPADVDDGLPVPLRIQVLESDYLDQIKDGIRSESGGPITQGIEFDGDGRRVAYWLYKTHPGSTREASSSESRRVPAKNVLHICRVERPGQVRGVPWLCSAIAQLNDLDEYADARLVQQKIAACFSVFVQDVDGAGVGLGEQSTSDPKLEELQPGGVQYLSPGKTVSFAQPPSVTDHVSFTQTNLRQIAAGLGVTYEDLTWDYSQVNFSSARMARLAHWGNVHDWRWNMLIPQFCDGVWNWFAEMAAGLNGWPAKPNAEWSPPPMPMLEPDKEGLAYQRLIRSGVMTLYQALREQGVDPEQHLKEIAQGNELLDAMKIWLDSDPRRTSAAGLTQERPGGTAAGVAPLDDDTAE